jgi:hypothetical protein
MLTQDTWPAVPMGGKDVRRTAVAPPKVVAEISGSTTSI